MSPTSGYVKHRKQAVKPSPLQTIDELDIPSLWGPQNEYYGHQSSKLDLFSLNAGGYGNDEKRNHSRPIARWVRSLQHNMKYHVFSRSSCRGRNSEPGSTTVPCFIAALFATIALLHINPNSLLLPLVSRHRRLYYTMDERAGYAKVESIIDLNILLKPSSTSNQNFHKPDQLRVIRKAEYDRHDYGEIQFPERLGSDDANGDSMHNNRVTVDIQKDRDSYESYRESLVSTWDDAEHISKEYWQKDDLEDTLPKCRIPSWKSTAIPTCNAAHEVSFERIRPTDQEYNITYMGCVVVFACLYFCL